MNKIMENNEVNEEYSDEEETLDTSAEDVKDEVQEDDSQGETIETLKGQVAKYKAIADRKEKKLQTNKINTVQGAPTLEHMALFGQGATLEGIKIAENVAKVEDISLTEAFNGDYVQSRIAQDLKEATVKANTLPASGGSAPAPRAKAVTNMTDEEHRAFAEERLANM